MVFDVSVTFRGADTYVYAAARQDGAAAPARYRVKEDRYWARETQRTRSRRSAFRLGAAFDDGAKSLLHKLADAAESTGTVDRRHFSDTTMRELSVVLCRSNGMGPQ